MGKIISYKEKEISRKSNLFGALFKRSKYIGYGSKEFIDQIMTSKLYDKLYNLDEGYDWCDECWLLRRFENIESFKKRKSNIDDFELWFMGYLYKYWTSTRKITRQEAYKILPFDKFHNRFEFYHTQGWDFIINDVIKLNKK